MLQRFSLSRRLFFALGSLLVVTLIGLGIIGAIRLEQMELQAVHDRLNTKAAELDDLARSESIEQLQSQLTALHNQFDSRITLIARDGTVLADSDCDAPGGLDNHGQRPEIVDARTHSFGTATRHSSTLNQPMTYVARRVVDAKSPVAFVRVALPVETIQEEIRHLRLLISIVIGMTAAVALILAWTVVRRLMEPLDELERGAAAVAKGHYGQRVYVEGEDDIGQLAHAFNLMSVRLAEQVAQLEQDRQQLRAVLGSMVEGVIAVDAEFNVVFANERAAELLGFASGTATGRKLWEVIRLRPVLDLARRTLARASGNAETLESIVHAERSLTARAAPLPGDSAHGGVIVFHDLTDLARLERVRQEFVANVSHELKTPLAVIVGSVETLQSGAIDDLDNRDRFLDNIATQSNRLSALIGDLLALARIETSAEQLPVQNVDLQNAVAKCIKRHEARAGAKQLALQAASSPPGVVASANEAALGEVLDHLVMNAVEYTAPGGVVEFHLTANGNHCSVGVRDTGIGIPAEDLPRIFERFYRVEKARTRDSGGAGLGLSIVKHLVQKMGGTVHVLSESGKGSTFVVALKQAS